MLIGVHGGVVRGLVGPPNANLKKLAGPEYRAAGGKAADVQISGDAVGAWRQARVCRAIDALEYLTQIKNTELAKISEAIKEAGGVEILARKAAKELPKAKRSTAATSNATNEDAEVASAATEVETQGSRQENRRNKRSKSCC
jgi:hypothetical protein